MNQSILNPADELVESSFLAEAQFKTVEESALVAAERVFKMALFSNGVQLGWMGKNDSGWAVLVTDESQAIQLEQYPYNGVTYFRITDSSSYMSVSNNSYVGFYNWLSATGFRLDGSTFVSDYNGQKLSLYSTDNSYLYAWDAYTVLNVKFI